MRLCLYQYVFSDFLIILWPHWRSETWNMPTCNDCLFLPKKSSDSHRENISAVLPLRKHKGIFLSNAPRPNNNEHINFKCNEERVFRGHGIFANGERRRMWRCQPQSPFKWLTRYPLTLTVPLSCHFLLCESFSVSLMKDMAASNALSLSPSSLPVMAVPLSPPPMSLMSLNYQTPHPFA